MMPILYMRTETVRALGQQLQRFTAISEQENSRLSNSLQNLATNWQGGSSEYFYGEMQSILSRLQQLSGEGETLKARLLSEVDEWERIDSQYGSRSRLGIALPDWFWGRFPKIDIPKLIPAIGLLPLLPIVPFPLLSGVPSWLSDKVSPIVDATIGKAFPQPTNESGVEPSPEPSPAPEQRHSTTPPRPEQQSTDAPHEQPDAGRQASPVPLNNDVKPGPTKKCAEYVQQRRSDLGRTANGSAYSYIDKFENKVFKVDPNSNNLQNQVAEGYAVVWEPGQQGADDIHGHVALVEEVGPDYVVISESGWRGGTKRRLPLDRLAELHIIP